ncbi:MAG: hypothetical protein K2P58_09060 [Hyphomonadaceae bacterium]|nr:hypothetical protein [Hyphomonadaceae bacterium]
MTRLGEVGKREAYDPERHDLSGSGATRTVRITARGVARGGEILVKLRAAPVARREKKQ